jgi:HPt (histidine-containing phosphotransfer) domain-containing protein
MTGARIAVTISPAREPLLDQGKLDALTVAMGAELLTQMLNLLPDSVAAELGRIEQGIADGDRDAVRLAVAGLREFAEHLGLVQLSAAAGALDLGLDPMNGRDRLDDLQNRLAETARDTLKAVAAA